METNIDTELSNKLNNVTNIETVKLDDLTIYLHNNKSGNCSYYYMSVLSLNIFNHPLNTRCIETARLKCIRQLEYLLRIKINKYNDDLTIINNILKKTN